MAYADTESFTRTYTSFSGADILCLFANVPIMEAQGISYSVTREYFAPYSSNTIQ